MLYYDRSGQFAAQFMRRDRSVDVPDGVSGAKNNSMAQGGYDAYFGAYTVDDERRTVTQHLLGAGGAGRAGAAPPARQPCGPLRSTTGKAPITTTVTTPEYQKVL